MLRDAAILEIRRNSERERDPSDHVRWQRVAPVAPDAPDRPTSPTSPTSPPATITPESASKAELFDAIRAAKEMP